MSDRARNACAERCAEFGEPPCYELDRHAGEAWAPCDACLRDIGAEVPEPVDPDAVVRPLL